MVLLDEALLIGGADAALIGREVRFRAVPFGRDGGDPSVAEISVMVGADALQPRPPVHARAYRRLDGVMLGFVRQTRTGGDVWETVDVPLGEEREAYSVEILDGSVVKRSFETPTPFILYATAEEIADFGAAQTALSLRISQLSPTVGAGPALTCTIPIW